jgi:hypothetical protein
MDDISPAESSLPNTPSLIKLTLGSAEGNVSCIRARSGGTCFGVRWSDTFTWSVTWSDTWLSCEPMSISDNVSIVTLSLDPDPRSGLEENPVGVLTWRASATWTTRGNVVLSSGFAGGDSSELHVLGCGLCWSNGTAAFFGVTMIMFVSHVYFDKKTVGQFKGTFTRCDLSGRGFK